MTGWNPFTVTLVLTVLMLTGSMIFGVLAPTLNIETPEPPHFPSLPDLTVYGNFSESYAFNETHNVYGDSSTALYSAFEPDKQVGFQYTWLTAQQFYIMRYSGFLVWYNEPVYTLDGVAVFLAPEIVALFVNTTSGYSTFIVDPGTPYECYARFGPLSGYSNLYDSWNIAHGFELQMYGNSYVEPDALTQAGAYLSWFGSVLAYFILVLAYLVQVASVMLIWLGLWPELTYGIIILISVLFIGSLIMFIRGNGGSK